MGWFLGVIGKLHDYECLIYIFTKKIEDGTPIIFDKTINSPWYKELRTYIDQYFTQECSFFKPN